MACVMVVDDDQGVRNALGHLLRNHGYETCSAPSGESALEMIEREPPDLVVMDVGLPGLDGLATFRRIQILRAGLPVVIFTGSSTMDIAIEASKLGAFDYQLKPFDPRRILEVVERALRTIDLVRQHELDPPVGVDPSDDMIVGQSLRMQEVYSMIGRVTATDATVLIRGESGTGKELVAKAIHRHSLRSDRPLIVVNCVAIPETLLESELFGYERGAFTGATSRHLGTFERAHGGTILLDEIGDVPIGVQGKILRVLQEKTFERVGGSETLRADVRILAATHREVERAIVEGRFREDLYHRLNVVTIHLPPLRDRREDIPVLASSFLARFAVELNSRPARLTAEALDLLISYGWPGNVRELEHCLKRALIFSRGLPIQAEDLRRALESRDDSTAAMVEADETVLQNFIRDYLSREAGAGCEPRLMETVERELLSEAMRRSGGNQSRAAELLGMARPTLHARLQKHGIRTHRIVEGSA